MTDATVGALLDEMTLAEKVAQLGTVRIGSLLTDGSFSPAKAAAAVGDGVGRVTRVGRESGLAPADLAREVRAVQRYLREETRLGVPAHVREEGLCGYAGRGGTAVPQRIGLASTWNPALVRRVDRQIARQLDAVGCTVTLSPVADLGVDPRWGRIEETYGEDPYLAARMTVASVRGLQDTPGSDTDADDAGGAGDGGDDASVLATLKHLAGHGRSAGGRNRADVTASRRTLRGTDLVPFRAGIDHADAASVMAAYHAVDGVPCHASRWLLTDVLRGEWGFEGTVVSDGRGVDTLCELHDVAADRREAGVLALRAGVDVELPETACFGDRLVAAVRDGDVAESVVDRAVRRELRGKARAGLLDGVAAGDPADVDDGGADSGDGPPATAATSVTAAFDDAATRGLVREAARQSLTLLTDPGGMLPVDDDATVAVVGPNGDAPRALLGDYSYAAAEGGDAGDVVTPAAGLRERLGPERVSVVRGCRVREAADDDVAAAVEAARAADVAVVCVGGRSGIDVERDSTGTAGEALDRATLGLPGRQPALVRAVAETGTPTVVVLVNGRPLAVGGAVRAADAVVEAWLPGVEGGRALASVLVGDAGPGGRLPVSVPASVGQLPVHSHRSPAAAERGTGYVDADADPLFPLGHGETYTSFAYDDLRLADRTVPPDGTVVARVGVENTGDRPGEEVVQAYVRDVLASRVRPSKRLVGFERLALAPGERATVRFRFDVTGFGFVDREGRRVVEPGEFRLFVGRSADDVRETASVAVEGSERRTPAAPSFAATAVERDG